MEDRGQNSVRCAIYTRKSTLVGASQEWTSLEAQREVCSAYIRCHAHLGWSEVSTLYADEGWSGGDLNRPALTRLLADMAAGEIDVVLFYKIDRLTRSLADFVRLMDGVQRLGVAFVSVTQSFDTSTSMGRMVLNILLTFAQFEREMLSDRVRDKLLSMRQRGLHVQGPPPLGYDRVQGRLVVNEAEAKLVRTIFERYQEFPNAHGVLRQLQAEGVRCKQILTRKGKVRGGGLIERGTMYSVLKNPVYIGFIRSGTEWFPGVHPPIVERSLWDSVQQLRAVRTKAKVPWDRGKFLLRDLLLGDDGRRYYCSERGGGVRYYQSAPKSRRDPCSPGLVRVNADETERLVVVALRGLLDDRTRLKRLLLSGQPRPSDKHLEDAGSVASQRVDMMNRTALREWLVAVLDHLVVTVTDLRLYISIAALEQFLSWDGFGHFQVPVERQKGERLYLLSLDAQLTCAHRDFSLPVQRSGRTGAPNRKLVNLLRRALSAQRLILEERETSPEVLAKRFRLSVSAFHRLLRVNYLAPDIRAAILDGQQPSGLSVRDLMYKPMPLDWTQQRRFFKFTEIDGARESSPVDVGAVIT
ncbi:recombinase family protein [Sphingomonas ginkgonis]|uniref:Recombinase family protein n=1 Tax=Sphingomonas ginkgonis TaxID=2315330 RepID=A0A429VBE2_9SPHN|nr:recombinase family protein [Sphingomonas ginkgonis]RST31323.1 recombinase family protein [Sphingomonas ginkgonis]